jgi:hypothetical protein
MDDVRKSNNVGYNFDNLERVKRPVDGDLESIQNLLKRNGQNVNAPPPPAPPGANQVLSF